ncbi:PfkB family carbohydrate kinase [Opitutales bacterium]|nr:PfkB family carbohydrate kinase [Opitutales bacterium]MDC0646295.1 PfkB family carbohydrate kinase [Opitutales bacterium]
MPDIIASDSSESSPLLVVGSVAFDNVITPQAEQERILGGAASYCSFAASYYTQVRMVGVVGNDFGESDLDRLRARGIDLEGVKKDDSGPTFFWKGKYHENFNRRDTLDIQLNVFEKFRPDLPESYKDSSFVLLGNIHPALQMHVLDQLAGNSFVLADTIDLWIETERESLLSLIKKVSLFVINDSEAEELTGESNVILAGEKLRQMGPESVIIKKGEHGAILFHEEGMFALPAYPVTQLHDPTGAGDSFAGALIGRLSSQNRSDFSAIKEAMLYATCTASLTVEAFGCDRLESAGKSEIEERVASLNQLISVT